MLTILVADDEQHIREGIANSLNWRELQIDKIFQAADGQQALQIARENKIDILLSDIRMPVVDGIQLSRGLLEMYPDCIIIFMSAYSDKEYLMSAIKLKASNYIEKPLQAARLEEVLEEAVKSYRKNEYIKLKSIMVENDYKISMPLIKNEIALLAANKNADMNLLLDCIKNSMLGITANTSYISVIVKDAGFFSTNPYEKNSKAARTEFFSGLAEFLYSNGFLCFWGTRDEEEYAVHIYSASNSLIPDQRQISVLLEQWLDRFKNRKIFISIGTVVPDFTQIYKSYANAGAALNKCFFRGYGSVVCYMQDIAKVSITEKEIIDQFNDILENSKQEAAIQFMQDFSHQLHRYENADVNEIKNVYSKLTAVLLTNLQNYGISHLLQYQNENSLRNAIFPIHTLSELDDYCRRLLGIYFETVKKIQSVNSISMIINYIERNFTDKSLDINQISQNTFLSPAYLCTYFKRETGKTINQYITGYRLKKAAEYLKDKKYRISDVAGLIGYDDNYFARIFKKKYGSSPSEFRERYGVKA